MPSTQSPQDIALATSAAADAITVQANAQQSSQLHFQGYYAHTAAAAAWNAVGTNTAKSVASTAQAGTHLTSANALKAAGK